MKGILQRLLIFAFIYIAVCDDSPIVSTKTGPVKGIVSKDDKGIAYKFLRIPFAKPPVGNLRFSKPEPVEPWNDVIDGSEHPVSCMQSLEMFKQYLPTLELSEDCLYLSVYVPNELSSANKKSVMVWIHGGGYYIGQASMYDASDLALAGDVIIVTINYRLNIFGFFTTWDSVAPGNYGMWDQILALRWVQDNIESFGGNPNSVTIFGESAGGFSVSLLSLIPSNKGLFHRVIAQSGTGNAPLAFNEKYRDHLKKIYEDVGCNERPDDSKYLVDCLRKVEADMFTNISLSTMIDATIKHSVIPFAPRYDNELFSTEPSAILKDSPNPANDFRRSLDQMVGFTDAEGAWIVNSGSMLAPDEKYNVSEGIPTKFFCKHIFPTWARGIYDNSSEVSDALCKFYAVENGDTTNKIEQAKNGIDAASDFMVVAPSIHWLNTQAMNNKVGQTYHYVFSRPRSSGLMLPPMPDWFKGAPHGFEIPYLFQLEYFAEKDNTTLEDGDYKLALEMMKYWTNFAKTGNPNSDSLPVWPQYTEENMEYMNLNLASKPDKATNKFKERMKFWINEIPNIMKQANSKEHEEL